MKCKSCGTNLNECKRCGKRWVQYGTKKPQRCADQACRTPYWDKDYKFEKSKKNSKKKKAR